MGAADSSPAQAASLATRPPSGQGMRRKMKGAKKKRGVLSISGCGGGALKGQLDELDLGDEDPDAEGEAIVVDEDEWDFPVLTRAIKSWTEKEMVEFLEDIVMIPPDLTKFVLAVATNGPDFVQANPLELFPPVGVAGGRASVDLREEEKRRNLAGKTLAIFHEHVRGQVHGSQRVMRWFHRVAKKISSHALEYKWSELPTVSRSCEILSSRELILSEMMRDVVPKGVSVASPRRLSGPRDTSPPDVGVILLSATDLTSLPLLSSLHCLQALDVSDQDYPLFVACVRLSSVLLHLCPGTGVVLARKWNAAGEKEGGAISNITIPVTSVSTCGDLKERVCGVIHDWNTRRRSPEAPETREFLVSIFSKLQTVPPTSREVDIFNEFFSEEKRIPPALTAFTASPEFVEVFQMRDYFRSHEGEQLLGGFWRIAFASHSQLDSFVHQCRKVVPGRMTEEFASEWALLKAIDRLMWQRAVKFPADEGFAAKEDGGCPFGDP